MKFNVIALKEALRANTLPSGYLMDAAVATLVCGWKLGSRGDWMAVSRDDPEQLIWTGYRLNDFRPSVDQIAAAFLPWYMTAEERDRFISSLVRRVCVEPPPQELCSAMCAAALEAVLSE
jgi:hypothetical protein